MFKLGLVKSKLVCNKSKFKIGLETQYFDLGFCLDDWGVRIMVGFYHICYSFKIKWGM